MSETHKSTLNCTWKALSLFVLKQEVRSQHNLGLFTSLERLAERTAGLLDPARHHTHTADVETPLNVHCAMIVATLSGTPIPVPASINSSPNTRVGLWEVYNILLYQTVILLSSPTHLPFTVILLTSIKSALILYLKLFAPKTLE